MVSRSVSRRYTVSSRCSGVSVSEIWISATAKLRRLARSPSHRVKNVLPDPYSPRTALNTDPPAATALSSASTAEVKRSSPVASRSSPLSGTAPRRSASIAPRRRAALTWDERVLLMAWSSQSELLAEQPGVQPQSASVRKGLQDLDTVRS